MPRRFALFLLVLATVSASSVFSTTTSVADESSAELCFGQAPTIVGTPGEEEVVGTEGADVVVTNGALGARTLGGDDLLCLTGVDPTHQDFFGGDWDTGRGNDRIDATGGVFPNPSGESPYNLNIHPGPGQDEVIGGPHTLSTGLVIGVSVYAADESAGQSDADVIKAGDGRDYVVPGAGDVVDLGGDDDYMFITDEGDLSGGVFDGGEGRNFMSLYLWPPINRPNEHHSWKINNRAERLARNGDVVATMSGFLDFDVQVKGPLTFIGSDLAETFDAPFLPPLDSDGRHNWPLSLEMHGGDDDLVYIRGGSDSRFDGGDGTDRFTFADDTHNTNDEIYCFSPRCSPEEGFLDLSTGALRLSYIDGPEVGTHAVNFENVRWWSSADGTIMGTDGPNTIVTQGHIPGRDMIIYGTRGDDYLRSGLGKDLLVGGQGHDVADGGPGRSDRCKAEARTHCEF